MPRRRASRWLYLSYCGSSKPLTPARLRNGGVAVALEDLRDLHPLRKLLQLPRGDDERHPVEPLLEFVLAGVRLVVDQIVVLVLVVAILVHLGHDRELIGMFEVEEQFDRPLRPRTLTDSPRITADSDVRRCWPSSRSRVLW